jgi:hypothetical protein
MEQALQLPRLHLDTFVAQPKFLDPIAPPTVPFPPPTWCALLVLSPRFALSFCKLNSFGFCHVQVLAQAPASDFLAGRVQGACAHWHGEFGERWAQEWGGNG